MDDSLIENAIALHQTGRLSEAEVLYRGILTGDPDDIDATYFLGVLAGQSGRPQDALRLMRRAIELDPGYAEAHFNLGALLAQSGDPSAAIASYRTAIQHNPDYVEARFNMADLLLKTGRKDDGIDALKSLLNLKPDHINASGVLANALVSKGDLPGAIDAYQNVVRLLPSSAEAFNNLGSLLGRQGNYDGAIAACLHSIKLKPDHAETHFNLATAYLAAGRVQEAIASYREAIRIKPDYIEAHHNLANAQIAADEPESAIQTFQHAIQLNPRFAHAHCALGNALKAIGRIADSISAYRCAVSLNPSDARLHSNLLYGLMYDPHISPKDLYSEHRHWAQKHTEALKSNWPSHTNDRAHDRRLRVGYVSSDFSAHPVGRFILPLLSHHNHERFEIFCYSGVRSPDAWTEKIRVTTDTWREIGWLSDDQAAALIRDDRIDLLIDLTLHSAKDRLLLFARKPAPVQACYLAYPGTTGMTAIDYRISDVYLDPPGASLDSYSERTIRLPSTYWCYDPPLPDLLPGPLPAARNGFITFGCLNNFCKVSERTLTIWANLLAAVSGSRLAIHSPEGHHRASVLEIFDRAAVDPARITFVPRQSLPEYMNYYSNIDIALDPFPYAGGTTTCDALWMGVPVVTLAGRSALERSGVSILSAAGLPDFIANTPEQYLQIASSLARDRNRLTQFRQSIRTHLSHSALMDAARFATDMENAYRQMWHAWCRSGN
jgi:predicted O-linked N-acetylglucosamine transferase (SPINDLY family)